MSKEINLPPFYVGQRVVAIEDHSQLYFKKGDEFRVLDLHQMGCCGAWAIDIGHLLKNEILRCACKKIQDYPKHKKWYCASKFAPITATFQSISYEKVLENESPLISVN